MSRKIKIGLIQQHATPDKENNLATALFLVTSDAVHSRVHVDGAEEQAFKYNISAKTNSQRRFVRRL